MRLFIALDIPAEIRGRIAEFMERLRKQAPEARWVKPESLHVTLKFLGEVQTKRLTEIQNALCQVEVVPFSLAFKGTGFFPNAKSPRVFWIGVEAPLELARLAQSVDRKLQEHGFPLEERAFSPHLTLARAAGHPGSRGKYADRGLNQLDGLLAKEHTAEFGTMTAEELFLYESRLSSGGAVYTKLMRFPFRPIA